MKFQDFEKLMRQYEQGTKIIPGIHVMIRLNGRNFKELREGYFDEPFDQKFQDIMIDTMKRTMSCGFTVPYAYTYSDEMSLLLSPDENMYGRRSEKLLSILTGEASTAFTLETHMGSPFSFNARLYFLPSTESVIDYFRWRQEDCRRNALNAHCQCALRLQGRKPKEANAELLNLSAQQKTDLVNSHYPIGQIHLDGIGAYWIPKEKVGIDQRTGKQVCVSRHDIKTIVPPHGYDYDKFLQGQILGPKKKDTVSTPKPPAILTPVLFPTGTKFLRPGTGKPGENEVIEDTVRQWSSNKEYVYLTYCWIEAAQNPIPVLDILSNEVENGKTYQAQNK